MALLPVWKDLDQQHQVILAAAVGVVLAALAFLQLQPSTLPQHIPRRMQADRDVVHTERKAALDPTQWKRFKLIDKIAISPNTAMFVPLVPPVLFPDAVS